MKTEINLEQLKQLEVELLSEVHKICSEEHCWELYAIKVLFLGTTI